MDTYYIPSEDAFAEEFTAEQFTRLIEKENTMQAVETIYMTPEVFAATWMVVDWMRAKWQAAMNEGTLLEVEVQSTPFGRYVLSLNVVNGN